MTQFSHCKKAEIFGLQEGPVRAAVTMGATSGLMVIVPREIKCPLRTPLNIRFYDPIQGVVLCRCRLTHPAISGAICTYRCQILEHLAQLQRREDIKVGQALVVNVDCEGIFAPATILNISAGGVYLASSLVAGVGDRLTFSFPPIQPPLMLHAEILRVELQVIDKRSLYGYGCHFTDLSVGEENQLRRYVFQEERKIYLTEN